MRAAPERGNMPVYAAGLVALVIASCHFGSTSSDASEVVGHDEDETMKLTSSAFEPGQSIPVAHTCEGEDRSPPLSWTEVPEGTRSFALVVDDPDAPDPAAPKRVWVHWIVFNLPPEADSLREGASTSLPAGAATGSNDWGKLAYGGPCPPIGRHRYFHRIYALDTTLELDRPTKAELEQAMRGHVLGRGELVGTYQKHG